MVKKFFALSGMLLLLAACGTDEEALTAEEPVEEPGASEPAASGAEDAKTVSGRELLVTLEQATAEPVKRNEAAAAIKESHEFKEGHLGEPTEELAEDMAVQAIEAEAVSEAIVEVYGGYEKFDEVGVRFLKNQTSGADKSGIWVGIKNPDERVRELASVLQKRVDAGEILAEPIYIYKSAHTGADLYALMEQASEKVESMKEAHANSDSGSYSLSVDTITGAIEIGHNFLSESEIQELKNAFPDQEVIVKQEGMMVPAPGEPTVTYPEPAVTTEPSNEGDYVVSLEEDRFLAVATKPQDFSANGGQGEFYSAIYYNFDDAAKLLEVGQRVKIEGSGMMLESYPGQTSAVFVEVLPTYQPESADITEAEAVKLGIASLDAQESTVPIIKSVTYSAEEDTWVVVFDSGDQEIEKNIEDKK